MIFRHQVTYQYVNKRSRKTMLNLFFETKRSPLQLKQVWREVFMNLSVPWTNPSPVANPNENETNTSPSVNMNGEECSENFTAKQSCVVLPFGKENQIHFVLDTGCSANILRFEVYQRIKASEVKRGLERSITFTNIQGVKSLRTGFVTYLSLPLGKEEHIVPFFVFIDCQEFKKNYLGNQFLQQTQAIINMRRKKLMIGTEKIPLLQLTPQEIIDFLSLIHI